MATYGMSATGLPLGDSCTVDVYRITGEVMEQVAILEPIYPSRLRGIAGLVAWAADAGATVTLGNEFCDDEVCTFAVDMHDGLPGEVYANVHHDTSNLDLV